jgi:hypothetical protein
MMNLKLSTVTLTAIAVLSVAGWLWLLSRVALKLF